MLLLFAGVASAQEKPAAPKPKTDRKVFIAGVSLLAAAKTADAITTRQLLDRGGWENDPVFGRHPSPAKQSLINLGIFGAQAGLFYLTEHNPHAWVRWTGRALIGHEILEHSRAAACNAGVDTHSPVIQNCGPLRKFLKTGRAAASHSDTPLTHIGGLISMKATVSLSPGQQLAVSSTYSFARIAAVYLRAALPIVRESDAVQLQSLIDLGELSLTRLSQHFPEVRPLVDGGV